MSSLLKSNCHQTGNNRNQHLNISYDNAEFPQRPLAYGMNNSILLLLFLPLGVLAGSRGWNTLLVTAWNYLALIPLSALIVSSSHRLSQRFGGHVGSLIDTACANSMELTAGTLALIHGDTDIAQSILMGRIFSDVLMVLGCCLMSTSSDGCYLQFRSAVAYFPSSFMVLSTMPIIIHSMLYATFRNRQAEIADNIVQLSRCTAPILLLFYLYYVYHQTKSEQQQHNKTTTDNNIQTLSASTKPAGNTNVSFPVTTLIGSVLGMAVCSHFLVNSIGTTSRTTHISMSFMTTILIPTASNSPRGIAMIAIFWSGNVPFATSMIIWSVVQISVSVTPLLVILGWTIQQPMSFNFPLFDTVILFISVLAVNHILRKEKHIAIHGFMLLGFYTILATAFYLQ